MRGPERADLSTPQETPLVCAAVHGGLPVLDWGPYYATYNFDGLEVNNWGGLLRFFYGFADMFASQVYGAYGVYSGSGKIGGRELRSTGEMWKSGLDVVLEPYSAERLDAAGFLDPPGYSWSALLGLYYGSLDLGVEHDSQKVFLMRSAYTGWRLATQMSFWLGGGFSLEPHLQMGQLWLENPSAGEDPLWSYGGGAAVLWRFSPRKLQWALRAGVVVNTIGHNTSPQLTGQVALVFSFGRTFAHWVIGPVDELP